MADWADQIYCSFCGKDRNEVSKMIAGPTVFICSECVELSFFIISNEKFLDVLKKMKEPLYG